MNSHFGTLTPDGAALLRAARDRILREPESFDWSTWECGTKACIAGHCFRVLTGGKKWHSHGNALEIVIGALGFTYAPTQTAFLVHAHPLYRLFFQNGSHNNGRAAANCINDLLWDYGYPPDAPTVPEAPPLDQLMPVLQ